MMAGFREFAAGEPLTATNVDDFLMKQSVMKFANAAARDLALGTAVVSPNALREGMIAYLDDTDDVLKYDGSAWVTVAAAAIGSNVVQTVKTNTFSTSSASFVDVTGLTVTITPSSASSKIIVIAQVSYAQASGAGYGHFKLAGGNSGDYIGDTEESRIRAVFGGGSVPNNTAQLFSSSIVYLDSPATAAPVTYSVSVRQAGTGSVIVNRSSADGNEAGRTRGASSITVIEVAA
jgi:hypothetical protein